MMDALEEAKRSMKWKEEWREKANYEADEEKHAHQVQMERLCRADATTYAAIAQAEQLTRIGDALYRWMSIQGVLPEFFEAVDRAKQTQAENAQLYQRIAELEGEHDDDDDREAIQPGDYRYFTGTNEPRELPF